MPEVKTGMTNVAGHLICSHIRKVSQAVSAAMSQVHQGHMRTRLYNDTNEGRIFLRFEINKLFSLFPNIFCYFPKLCTAKSYAELTVLFLPTLKCNSSILSDLPGNRQP